MSKELIKYIDLIKKAEDWGMEFTRKEDVKDFKENPDDSSLNLGYLALIVKLLQDIKKELRKRKLKTK